MIADPGGRGVHAPILVVVSLLIVAVALGGCASVPSNGVNSRQPQVDPPPPSTPTPTPSPQESVSVSITPQSISLQAGATQAFSASVANDPQGKGVSWSFAGCSGAACGTLSSMNSASGDSVTYTAPQLSAAATITLTAAAVADSSKAAAATISVAAATGPPAPITVAVTPQTHSITINDTQQFSATVQNDPKAAGVTWTLSGTGCAGAKCGALSAASSASGASITYTAPDRVPQPPTVTLSATSVTDGKVSASATITIVKSVAVTVTPATATVPVNTAQAFSATVQNDPQNQGVDWSLAGAGCSGNSCGTLSTTSTASGQSVTYTAPAAAPHPPTVSLTATSTSDRKSSGAATITVFAIPENLSVTISPKRGGITVNQTLKFSATVQNDPGNTGVTWTANNGTFTNVTATSAVYHPPASAGVYSITATSALDPSKRASASIGVTDLAGVTTYHNDGTRAGVNSQEVALTTSNVNSSTFGKLFSCSVDAAVYTQTLWVSNVSIGGGQHNVIFAATSHDTVYAFDADASPCVTYWSKHLIPGGETWPNSVDMGGDDIYPDTGVVGTPVIDLAANLLYVVTKTKTNGTDARGPGECHQRLHALSLSTGSEAANGPIELTSSITVPGSGAGGNGSSVPFDPFHQNQRPGLALINGIVYVAWGSYIDQQPWHGWVMGFNGSNLKAAPLIFNATPNGLGAGIWMAGGAPSIDNNNNLYVMTGNGDFDNAKEFGDSFIKLNSSLTVQDWFTPQDQAVMDSANADLGSGGSAVVADLPSAPVQHLLIGGGKQGGGNAGEIYVINRDAMGHLEGSGSPLVQKFPLLRHIFATPAFWNNTLYIAGLNGPLSAFALDTSTALFNTTPISVSSQLFPGRGATASISANGTAHGIAWAIDASQYGGSSKYGTGPAVVHAFDAANLGRELWNSAQATANRDQAGNAVKFTVPTIANGKVYIGTTSEIDVYGLLPD